MFRRRWAPAIFRELGVLSPVAVCNLGWLDLRRERLGTANAAFTEALHLSELYHFRRHASYPVLGLACSAAAEAQWERAARLLGFADHELQACGESWEAPERTYRQQSLSDIERLSLEAMTILAQHDHILELVLLDDRPIIYVLDNQRSRDATRGDSAAIPSLYE